MNKTNDSVIVSWDFTAGQDRGVVIVGHKEQGLMTIVNAFSGEEAYDIYKKLTEAKVAE